MTGSGSVTQDMDVIDHVRELRRRCLTCAVFFLGAVAVLLSQGRVLLAWLEAPARGVISEFILIAPTEALTVYFKVVLSAAFIVSFPVMLYELWAFVAPALPRTSRRAVIMWFAFALIFFAGGIVFAYGILLPSALGFLVGFGQGIATPMISLSAYMSFAAAIVLVGGMVFEIPLVMGILAEAGLLNIQGLRASRRYAIVLIFILAAIITPTQDPFNMVLFAGPMVLLFEVGVVICAVIETRKKNLLQEKV